MDNKILTFLYLDGSDALVVEIIIITPNKRHESIKGGEVELHSQPFTRGTEWLGSSPGRFIPEKRYLDSH
jgi:hypothetical protein